MPPEPLRLRDPARDRWAIRFSGSVQIRDCLLYDYFELQPVYDYFLLQPDWYGYFLLQSNLFDYFGYTRLYDYFDYFLCYIKKAAHRTALRTSSCNK
jgi:hypothetical protein